MKNLCIIFTGTVASTLSEKIVKVFSSEYKVTKVYTKNAAMLSPFKRDDMTFSDSDEWMKYYPFFGVSRGYKKNDPIPHIDLAKSNNALLIIASADFISKMANGICDDLASSLYRAWHRANPIILAPAMNTHMWEHPVTEEQIFKLISWGIKIVYPVSKKLACGDEGMGALADIYDIKAGVDKCYENEFPLKSYNGIPISGHPGAFLTQRKHAPHTGVDLYTSDTEPVYAMNSGRVVSVEDFTGKFDGSTWWEDTRCVLIEHWFGVVCYGEIQERSLLRKGTLVRKGEKIGNVKRVLKEGKERPDIVGHSTSMLHIELYQKGQEKASTTYAKDKDILRDPTPYLLQAAGANPKLLIQG